MSQFSESLVSYERESQQQVEKSNGIENKNDFSELWKTSGLAQNEIQEIVKEIISEQRRFFDLELAATKRDFRQEITDLQNLVENNKLSIFSLQERIDDILTDQKYQLELAKNYRESYSRKFLRTMKFERIKGFISGKIHKTGDFVRNNQYLFKFFLSEFYFLAKSATYSLIRFFCFLFCNLPTLVRSSWKILCYKPWLTSFSFLLIIHYFHPLKLSHLQWKPNS